MKTIRSLTTNLGLSLVLFALGTTGAKAQMLSATDFAGTFSLSNNAQWGNVALPAGNYTLRYGSLSGAYFVEVRGTEKGSPHVVIHVAGSNQTSARKNALVCSRDGATLIVRALEMPAIGESATFALPRGMQLTAQQRNGSKNIQLAQGPMLIQRISVSLATK
jgi:hypothetical protein